MNSLNYPNKVEGNRQLQHPMGRQGPVWKAIGKQCVSVSFTKPGQNISEEGNFNAMS